MRRLLPYFSLSSSISCRTRARMWVSSESRRRIFDDVLEQFGVFAAQRFAFEVGQRAELHRDDGFRLIGREVVDLGDAFFALKVAETDLARAPGDQLRRNFDLPAEPLSRPARLAAARIVAITLSISL